MTQNKFLIVALIILSIPFLACTPGGGGGAPASGGGGAPAGAGQGSVDIDTEQLGPAASSAVDTQDGGAQVNVDTEQLSQITDAAGEGGNVDVAVDTEQIGTAVDTATAQTGEVDAGLLSEQFDSATIDENGNVAVSITEAETNQALQLALEASGSDVISNAYIAYTGGTIVFTGDMETGALRAVIRPYVNNGELNYEIVEATINGKSVPPAAYAAVEETINSTLAQVMGELPENVTLTGVSVGEGVMTITATIQA